MLRNRKNCSNGRQHLRTTVNNSGVQQAINLAATNVNQLKRYGPGREELAAAKMKTMLEPNEQATSESYYFLDHLRQTFLNPFLIADVSVEKSLKDSLGNTIQPEDVRNYCKSFFEGNNRDIIVKAPAGVKAKLLSRQKPEAWIAAADKLGDASLPLNTNRPRFADQFVADSANKIISSKMLERVSARELILANGARVIMRTVRDSSVTNKNIYLNVFLPAGARAFSNGDFYNALYCADIIRNSGAGGLNKFDIERMKGGDISYAHVYMYGKASGYNSTFIAGHEEDALLLMYQYFLNPVKNKNAFTDWLHSRKRGLDNYNEMPEEKFRKFIDDSLLCGTNAEAMLTRPVLDKINFERAFGIYKQHFSNAYGFTFVISGNFNEVKMEKLVNKYIGALPGEPRQVENKSVTMPCSPVKKATMHLPEFPDGKNIVKMIYRGKFEYSPKEKYFLEALTDLLQSVLIARLREKEGGTYVPVVLIGFQGGDSSVFNIDITFDCAPAQKEQLINAADEEIQELIKEGPGIDEFVKCITLKQGDFNAVGRAQFWSTYFPSRILNGWDINEVAEWPVLLRDLSINSLRLTASNYLTENNRAIFILAPVKN